MKNIVSRLALFAGVMLISSVTLWAQSNQVSGNVKSAEGDPLVGVNIVVVGTIVGTISDIDGNFSFSVKESFPFNIRISMVGFESQQLEVTQDNATGIAISLAEQTIMGQEVIISASRVEESILESPVTVEKMGILAIKNTPSADFYGGIADLKGVQMTTSSMMFKSVNTRGFATMANTRFVQLIDGMDNAAPGLNFPMGNIVGIGDLDVESVELVPGAASALYGPNAFNGILLMQSKSPFDYQGLSVTAKGGVTMQDPYSTNATNYPGSVGVKDEAAGTNGFYDFSMRYAKAFNNKFAFKVNFSYLQAEDWHATDYSQKADENPGTYSTNVNGLNIYGDDIAVVLDFDAITGAPTGTYGREEIARTGYREVDLADYNTKSMKASVGLHYRLTDKMELSYDYRYGNATSIYQGFSRYSLKNLTLQQHKLELRGDNFFIRAYGTFENAGDAYDTRFLAWNINRTWKDDTQWFNEYAGNYIGAVTLGTPKQTAHNGARAAADIGRLVPGTDEFDAVKTQISELADLATGSKFIDTSKMYHAEGSYDFKNQISWLNLSIGAHFRQYNLNSEGTIFNDAPPPGGNGPISINEFGGYAQFSKRLINDALNLGFSVRYDKNENFEGQFSPRAFAVYSVDAARKHNIRVSYQTGFRNGDNQTQFIALDLGPATLVGGTQKNLDMYSKTISFDPGGGNPVETYNIIGSTLYDNAYTASSAGAFGASGNPADLVIAKNELIKPEQITSYEIGYKGVFNNKLMLDINYYHNNYTDFIAQNAVVVVPEEYDVNLPANDPNSGVAALASASLGGPTLSYVYQLYGNISDPVTSNGIGIGINYLLPRGYDLGGSYNYADFSFDQEANPDDLPGFNTPNNRYKIQFGNREAFNNFGFNISYRWAEEYDWVGTFGNGPVPSFSSLDLQVSYKLSAIRSILKVGANNVIGTEFVQAYGAPGIGSTFYASLTFDELFNR